MQLELRVHCLKKKNFFPFFLPPFLSIKLFFKIMKSSIAFAIIAFALYTSAQESPEVDDIYIGCRNDLTIGPNICDKFGFISSQEV